MVTVLVFIRHRVCVVTNRSALWHRESHGLAFNVDLQGVVTLSVGPRVSPLDGLARTMRLLDTVKSSAVGCELGWT